MSERFAEGKSNIPQTAAASHRDSARSRLRPCDGLMFVHQLTGDGEMQNGRWRK